MVVWQLPLPLQAFGVDVSKEVPESLHLLSQRGALITDGKGLCKCQMIASLNSTQAMSCTVLLECVASMQVVVKIGQISRPLHVPDDCQPDRHRCNVTPCLTRLFRACRVLCRIDGAGGLRLRMAQPSCFESRHTFSILQSHLLARQELRPWLQQTSATAKNY